MLRTIKVAAMAAGLLLAVGGTAYADEWSDGRTLAGVYIRTNSGTPQVRLIATSSWGADCNSTAAYRNADDRENDHFLSVAMAAYLSGKQVRIYTNSSCAFTGVEVL